MKRDWVRAIAGRVVYILLGAVFMLWLLIFTGPAHGATFRGDEASCDHLAGFAAQMAVARDEGAPWEKVEEWLKMSLEVARSNPETYIKDQDDVDFVLVVMKRVFDNPSMTAEQAYLVTNHECMKSPPKSSLKSPTV